MTLVIAARGRRSIWMLADKRLSYVDRPPRDDARKIVELDTPDGPALVSYSGLGATPTGVEPSDWLVALLRNTGQLRLAEIIEILRKAAEDNLPTFLSRLRDNRHVFLVNALVHGKPELFAIAIQVLEGRWVARKIQVLDTSAPVELRLSPRLFTAGSGASFLEQNPAWKRELMCAVDAFDAGRVSALVVTQLLANNNYAVSLSEPSVGPNCWVSWRTGPSFKGEIRAGHTSFTGTQRDANLSPLPSSSNGIDLELLIDTLMKHGFPEGETEIAALNRELARTHTSSDGKLR